MVFIRIAPVILMVFFLTGSSYAQPEPSKKLIILHTNDLHSRLNGFSPEVEYSPLRPNDDQTLGGFARIATLIAREREQYGSEVLVMDAGDFLMGTFFSTMEATYGFQLSLMKKMGYDFVNLGNHEFDYGPWSLAKILGKSADSNTIPFLIASNISFSAKDTSDDALKALIDRKILNTYRVVEKNGLRLGIFGILGVSAIDDAPLARPVKFEGQACPVSER
jgi:5'-nucleotidase